MNQNLYIFSKLFLIALGLFIFSNKNFAQDCGHGIAHTFIEGNNLRAAIPLNGNLFWKIVDESSFHLTNSSTIPSPSTLFATGIWIGAMNDADELKIAAATYSSSTSYDFVPGPILNDNGQLSFDCENFDRLWEVRGMEINTHLSDFLDNGTVDQPLLNIYAYPGHQNPHFENIHGFNLPNTPQGLAPFHDKNSDGIYNPDDGDFPLPESVNPDRIPSHLIWGILNDAGTKHTGSGGDSLSVEIHQTVWSFYCDDNEVLNHTIFSSHKIINRGSEILDSLIVSKWADFDLGCYTDDLLGCIPDLNTYYSYNADSIDGTSGSECEQGGPTFGDNPPVQAITFLNHNMSSFGVYAQSQFLYNFAFSDPSQPYEFYSYMNGYWLDGLPFTMGGNGYDGTEITSFIYPDNPNDPNGWSMYTSNLPFGNWRAVGNTKIDGSFPPGAVVTLDMAYTFYQDENLNHIETVDLVYDNTPLLQQMYDDEFATGCNYVECVDDCVWTGDTDNDSIVTPFDILQIGLGYGEQGLNRNKPAIWQPFDGDNWTNNINGINLKHTDCNGNAIIDEIDFHLVDQHFGNSYKTISAIDEYPVGTELAIIPPSFGAFRLDSIAVNDFGFARIFVNQEEDLYGLAFTVEVDTQFLIIGNSLGATSPWGTTTEDFGFIKQLKVEGEFHYAFTKIDGNNSISQEQEIFSLIVGTKNNDYLLVETPIRIKNIKAVLNDGTELEYGSRKFTVRIHNPDGDGIYVNNENLKTATISIFPNPTSDFLNIKTDELPTHLSIFDIYGKSVLEKRNGFENEMQLSIDHFSAGVYFVKIKADEKDFVKKIVKF